MPTGESSPWAPLGQRAYRWLWLGVLISGIGTTMQTVGAQWLLIDRPNAAAVVALVQAANIVPVMLLAQPAGVLADLFDKRWLMFTVQCYFLAAGVLLVVLTAAAMWALLPLVASHRLGLGAGGYGAWPSTQWSSRVARRSELCSWGVVAQHAGLRTTFLVASVAALVAVVIGSVCRVPDTGHVDPALVTYWSDARLAITPEPDTGPVVVQVVYSVIHERQGGYLQAMDHLRRSRRRTGAVRWELYRDAEEPTRFVEMFRVCSWRNTCASTTAASPPPTRPSKTRRWRLQIRRLAPIISCRRREFAAQIRQSSLVFL